MKKLVSVLLALALILSCAASFAEAEAEEEKARTEFWLPDTLAPLEVEALPVEDFPTVKTKTDKGITTITVTGEVDQLLANWMGYGEESEEVLQELGFRATFTCDFGVNLLSRNPDCLFGLKRICRSHGADLAALLEEASNTLKWR